MPLSVPAKVDTTTAGSGPPVGVDFVHEMKVGLQAWLRKQLRDPEVAKHTEMVLFLEKSDPYTEAFASPLDIIPESVGSTAPLGSGSGSQTPILSCSMSLKTQSLIKDSTAEVDTADRIDHFARFKAALATAGTIADEFHDENDGVHSSEMPDIYGNVNKSLSNTVLAAAETVVCLEDFLLLKVVGKGSFGKVLQVRKIDTEPGFGFDQVEHTKTERNVLEYISHPFIVSLRYAFQTRNKLYFVLDFCSGGKMGKFSEELSRFYCAEMVLALEYLHNIGIVYRDLKPENVLLDAEGHIALTDFGLSKEGITDNSSTFSFCGTPEYLAPEILNRSGHGRAADWWSLGALLFEMLTGMPPFYSRDRERLFAKILKADLQFPRTMSTDAKSLLMVGVFGDRLRVCSVGTPLKDSEAAEMTIADRPENKYCKLLRSLDIRSHPFFADIDFTLMTKRALVPPFKPNVDANEDATNNFDAEFTNLAIRSVDIDPTSSMLRSTAEQESKFSGFTFVNHAHLK